VQSRQGSTEKLTGYHWLLLIAVFLGWAVVALDLLLMAFGAPQLFKTFHVSSLSWPALFFGVGDGIGALLFGRLNDTMWGRKRTFLITIAGAMVFTGLTAVSINWSMYTGFRFLAGLFSGGEMTAGWVILAEEIPIQRRSTFLSISQGGAAVGVFLAPVVMGTYASAAAFGWRAAYLTSFIFALAVLILRLRIRESDEWKIMVSKLKVEKTKVSTSLRQVFSGGYAKVTLITVVLFSLVFYATAIHDDYYPSWYSLGTINGIVVPTAVITIIFAGGSIAEFLANLSMGFMMDKWGSRKSSLIMLGMIPLVLAMWLVPSSYSYVLDFVIIFGVYYFFQTVWGYAPAYLGQLYPTGVRHSGMGITWAIAYGGFYSASAYFSGYSASTVGGWSILFIISMVAYGVFAIGMFFLAVDVKRKPQPALESGSSGTPNK
jgi:MFS family permease